MPPFRVRWVDMACGTIIGGTVGYFLAGPRYVLVAAFSGLVGGLVVPWLVAASRGPSEK